MEASIHSRSFGSLPTGELIQAWVLTGRGGLTLEALTYGGTVTKLLVPDRTARIANLVLGFNDLSGYLNGRAYFGAITGRVAGRITGGTFSLDGRTYELLRNDCPNHLHGGESGFNKKVWLARIIDRHDGAPCLRFAYCSADGEEGYPGSVEITVTYTVTDSNVFLIETEAASQQPTPFNLTHHSYFNLAGEESCSITDHILQIHADEAVVTDKQMTLLGRLQSVHQQANDLRKPRLLNAVIPSLFQNHGDLYKLRKPHPQPVTPMLTSAARLSHPGSGRVMDVSTTETFLQFYSGAGLDGTLTGTSGVPYGRYAGLCLECEGYPDGANTPTLGDTILRPGTPVRHATAYAFSVEENATAPRNAD